MDRKSANISAGVRDLFLADHHRLETLFERLLAAFEANDREEMARRWAEFESGLLAHMRVEETYLIPALQRVRPMHARTLVQEHRHIRTRLSELGVALDLHVLRLDTARGFVDELRGHAKSEDRLLYDGAEERLEPAHRETLLRSFAERLQARPAPRRVGDRRE